VSVTINTQIAGMKELEDALKELGSEVAGAKNGGLVRNALNAAGRSVVARMKENAPVDTGRLRNSIFKFAEKNPRRLSEIVYVGPRLGKSRADEKGAWYAAIVEFKTPFMRTSIKPEEDAATIRKNLASGIERVAKKIGNKNAAAVGARIKKL
jgi:hypothetical protein